MANWYGIDGIIFHYMGPVSDAEITYNGVRDTSGVIVEETMWERFTTDDYGAPLPYAPGETESTRVANFDQYMRDNANEVKDLIELARGTH